MAKSFNQAISILKKLSPVRDGRIVPNDGLYTAFDKNPKVQKDIDLVSAYVSTLKSHGLVTPNYTDGWPRRRESISLTDKAVDLLEGRRQPLQKMPPPPRFISLQEITDMVKEWNDQNRSYRIDPTPKLIDKEMPVEH